jgi:hypothetical protein
MITSERLNRFDLEINEVGHQEHFTVDGDVDLLSMISTTRNLISWAKHTLLPLLILILAQYYVA